MSTSLVLPGWSRCTVVGTAVEVFICTWSWSLICLLPWAPVSTIPILTTTVAWSHNTRIMCIVVSSRLWWCRARSLEVGALNLSLESLKSLHYHLHPLLLTRTKDRSLRGRTITELIVASLISFALHLLLVLHNSSSVFKD
jgi:hypothetical protein